MKILFDFFPIILFFIAYKFQGIYVATAVAMVAALAQTGWHRLKQGKFEKMHLVTLAMILVFGGLTLAFHDSTFIKWKPTVLNWVFSLAFLLSPLFGGKTLAERTMGQAVSLPAPIWMRLNLAWVLFFLISGGLNLYVAYHFEEETWVNFKLFGLLGLTFLFIIAQSFYLARYIQETDPDPEEN